MKFDLLKIILKVTRGRPLVVHYLSLTGIGGVQSSFSNSFPYLIRDESFHHIAVGVYQIDSVYAQDELIYIDLKKSIYYKLFFLYALLSKHCIIHFYNNIGSKKLYYLLKILKPTNIVLHERGTAWNVPSKDVKIYQENCRRASIVLTNSIASMQLLKQKFHVSPHNLHVVYNGILPTTFEPRVVSKSNQQFTVGFIGRLDTPKGVDVLIRCAKELKNIRFLIAGDGPLLPQCKLLAGDSPNVQILGRVSDKDSFFNQINLLVCPSIREPLGNSVIEAGFYKKAVVCSEIDGLPEIVSNNYSGILIKPTREIDQNNLPNNALPLPEFVYSPELGRLIKPLAIDTNKLSNEIRTLSKDSLLCSYIASNLSDLVRSKFSTDQYASNMLSIYNNLIKKRK